MAPFQLKGMHMNNMNIMTTSAIMTLAWVLCGCSSNNMNASSTSETDTNRVDTTSRDMNRSTDNFTNAATGTDMALDHNRANTFSDTTNMSDNTRSQVDRNTMHAGYDNSRPVTDNGTNDSNLSQTNADMNVDRNTTHAGYDSSHPNMDNGTNDMGNYNGGNTNSTMDRNTMHPGYDSSRPRTDNGTNQ